MRAEWVRTYTLAGPVATFLHLYADDDTELVALTEDEIRLVELAIRSEQGGDLRSAVERSFSTAFTRIAGIDETVDHTRAGNAGVVSEPDSPPAVVGGLDDVDAVVEAPPENARWSTVSKVTGDHVVAWLEVNPASLTTEICRGLEYKSSGSMGLKLNKLMSEGRVTRDERKRWSATTRSVPATQVAPPAPPKAPLKKAPAATSTQGKKNPDFRGPPVPPRPEHSNPSDDLGDQLVEIVETHGPLTPTLAHSCLPISVQARCSINDVSNGLKQLLDDGQIARPRIGMYEAAS